MPEEDDSNQDIGVLEVTSGSTGIANNAKLIQCVTQEAVQAALANSTQTQAPLSGAMACFKRVIVNLRIKFKQTNAKLEKLKTGGGKKKVLWNYYWFPTYNVRLYSACSCKK